MSRPAERTALTRPLEDSAVNGRGYKRCPECRKLYPDNVSRCRRRQCPSYAPTWARATMRKIRENLRAYGGLVCMCTLTAPGQAAGLAWDRANCTHSPTVPCGRGHGCKVLPAVASHWNERSRGWWRELNRVAKLRADRAVGRL